jgi:hypothetical protein
VRDASQGGLVRFLPCAVQKRCRVMFDYSVLNGGARSAQWTARQLNVRQ